MWPRPVEDDEDSEVGERVPGEGDGDQVEKSRIVGGAGVEGEWGDGF